MAQQQAGWASRPDIVQMFQLLPCFPLAFDFVWKLWNDLLDEKNQKTSCFWCLGEENGDAGVCLKVDGPAFRFENGLHLSGDGNPKDSGIFRNRCWTNREYFQIHPKLSKSCDVFYIFLPLQKSSHVCGMGHLALTFPRKPILEHEVQMLIRRLAMLPVPLQKATWKLWLWYMFVSFFGRQHVVVLS